MTWQYPSLHASSPLCARGDEPLRTSSPAPPSDGKRQWPHDNSETSRRAGQSFPRLVTYVRADRATGGKAKAGPALKEALNWRPPPRESASSYLALVPAIGVRRPGLRRLIDRHGLVTPSRARIVLGKAHRHNFTFRGAPSTRRSPPGPRVRRERDSSRIDHYLGRRRSRTCWCLRFANMLLGDRSGERQWHRPCPVTVAEFARGR